MRFFVRQFSHQGSVDRWFWTGKYSFGERLEDAHKRLENDNITNTLSALSVESRTADMIRRLVYIRARLMKSSSRIEAKKQKIRAQRERRHIPGTILDSIPKHFLKLYNII